jgi:hypothetical protein
MIRITRSRVALVSTVSLLALTGATTATSLATAATAHMSKKSKKHKKAKKKQPAKKAANVTVTAGTETLTFNAQVVQALEKAKVTTTAVSPATGALSSGFVFSLSGGTLNPATGLGSLTSTGGITFATSFSVPGLFSSESNSTISEPALALTATPTMSFTSEQASPPTFPFATVSLKGVHPVAHGAVITLTNLPASLSATGVLFLNQFASGAFSAGEALGTVTVQVSASY